jgi:DNA-binding ferritin-like protein
MDPRMVALLAKSTQSPQSLPGKADVISAEIPESNSSHKLLMLAICYRALQLASHNFHNLVGRTVFFQDHSFFGDLYGAAEGYYDSIIERIIGLYGEQSINLQNIMMMVSQKIQDAPNASQENKVFYQYCEQMLKYILSEIEQLAPSCSQGTMNLLAGQADEIEVLLYKIGRRLGQ